jgi:hypothetical protein
MPQKMKPINHIVFFKRRCYNMWAISCSYRGKISFPMYELQINTVTRGEMSEWSKVTDSKSNRSKARPLGENPVTIRLCERLMNENFSQMLTPCSQFYKKSFSVTAVKLYTERYRSGHNGADSKSVWRQRHEGSNPSLSAIFWEHQGICRGGMTH